MLREPSGSRSTRPAPTSLARGRVAAQGSGDHAPDLRLARGSRPDAVARQRRGPRRRRLSALVVILGSMSLTPWMILFAWRRGPGAAGVPRATGMAGDRRTRPAPPSSVSGTDTLGVRPCSGPSTV